MDRTDSRLNISCNRVSKSNSCPLSPSQLLLPLTIEDELKMERRRLAAKNKMSATSHFCDMLGGIMCQSCCRICHVPMPPCPCSRFADVLPGAKGLWLQTYRGLRKVKQSHDRNEVVYCNLEQNPSTRPVCSRQLPCLLRSGTLWCMKPGSNPDEERALLGQAPWQPIDYQSCEL